MSTIGRLQAALAAATNEVIVTAANLNFDFTLIKCEAPLEYQPLGNMLAAKKKSNAETGSIHVTARRLGALFEGACPTTPNLLKAYGDRISEISTATSQSQPLQYSESIFSTYAGIDGTSIWAAATSSKAALHVHLLGCMIARIFDPAEAVSIWVELVKERQKDIAYRFENGEQLPFSLTAAAAQNPIPKPELAEWDASARAWLRTADEAKKSEYSQLRALLRSVKIKVNEETDVFPSVMKAWKSAVVTMENLVSGQPQAVRDGSTLLALSSWHLYPNIAVFGSQNFEVVLNDSLISPGGTLSIGISPSKIAGETGVFWCLSLAQLRHYGKPVRIERSLQADPSRISFSQFLLCALGVLTALWEIPSNDIHTAMKFLVALATILEGASGAKWLSAVGRAASSYLSAEGEELEMANKLVQYGRRRARDFVPEVEPKFKPKAYFGLGGSNALLKCFKDDEKRIVFLRNKMFEISQKEGRRPTDFLIRFYPSQAQGSANHHPTKSRSEEEDGTVSHDDSTPDGRHWQEVSLDKTDFYSSDSDTEDEVEVIGDTACYATVTQGLFDPGSHSAPPFPLPQKWYGASHHRWICSDEDHESECGGEFHHRLFSQNLKASRTSFTIIERLRENRYDWLCGDLDTAAIFQRRSARPPASPEFSIEDFLSCAEAGLFSVASLIDHVSSDNSPVFVFFKALATVASIYKHIPDARLAIQNFQRPILQSKWHAATFPVAPSRHKMVRRMFKRTLALAIVAYFDSGTADLAPGDMENVMAVSSGDSIYVPSQLVSDPLERLKPRQLKRILGNFGKPGVVLLIPPQEPMMRELDYRKIMSLTTARFDGKQIDSFGRTSLHLSFTDHHVPVYDTNVKVGQDSQVSVIESVISVHDSGEWVADVDILDAINSDFVSRLPALEPCNHPKDISTEQGVFSIDTWDDILDCPSDRFVVRAHGNWLGRLATTSVLSQVLKLRDNVKITVCQPDTCWHCVWSQYKLDEPLLHSFIY